MKTISKSCIALVALLFSLTLANAQTTLFSENFGKPSANTLITAYSGWQNASPIAFAGTADVRASVPSLGYASASAGGNLWLAYNAITKYLQIDGINTANYSNLTLSFGLLKPQADATSDMLSVQVSSNGSDWSNLSIIDFPTTANAWTYVTCSGSIPSTSTLYLKLSNTQTGTYQFRIDDIKITGVGAAIPTISTSASALSYATLTNQAKSDTISVSGSDLTENISLALSGAGASMFSLTSSSVAASSVTKVGVIYNPTASGNHSATLTLSSTGKTKIITLTGNAYAANANAWVEDFETGLKTSYTAANVTCTQGEWELAKSMLGNTSSDKMFGTQSVRIREGIADSSYIAMNFDKTNGAGVVTIYTSLYGTHAAGAKWVLSMSTNAGGAWIKVGDTITTTNSLLAPVQFVVNQTGNVRFKIAKTNNTSSSTLNIDNITITDDTGLANLAEGKKMAAIYSVSDAVIVNLEEAATIEIFNLQGHKLKTISASFGQNIIELNAGLYLVKVGTQVEKIIVR